MRSRVPGVLPDTQRVRSRVPGVLPDTQRVRSRVPGGRTGRKRPGVKVLYLLSSPQRSGKTRWLQALLTRRDALGVPTYGVLAPGRWASVDGILAKVGIDNLLLPDRTLLSFASPASAGPAGDGGCAQSRRAGLGWDISDSALLHVNDHFEALLARRGELAARPGVMVVDELGPLELARGEGLRSALALLDAGPCAAWEDAVVVVRPALLEAAAEGLRDAWGEPEPLQPGSRVPRRLLGGTGWD